MNSELILITLPDFFDGETAICNRLFADGLWRLHLRKPEATRLQTATWIEEIEPQYRSRIVLHDHHELALIYGLAGIHLNRRNNMRIDAGELSVSRSCHSLEEVRDVATDYDYVFLSPIFDSISKQGYRAAFTEEELRAASDILSANVYALGGITFDNLAKVRELGFKGAAMMGGFWLSENKRNMILRDLDT